MLKKKQSISNHFQRFPSTRVSILFRLLCIGFICIKTMDHQRHLAAVAIGMPEMLSGCSGCSGCAREGRATAPNRVGWGRGGRGRGFEASAGEFARPLDAAVSANERRASARRRRRSPSPPPRNSRPFFFYGYRVFTEFFVLRF